MKKITRSIQMPKKIQILQLCLYLLGMTSCTSPLSNENLTDISLINARIEIIQNPSDKTDNSVMVELVDKNGNRISHDSLSIFVNGTEEKITHKQGLYYNNESKYIFANIPVNEMYKIEIKLSDNKIHFLGEIKALAEEKSENIICQDVGDINHDFIINWHNLNDIDELSVFIGTVEQTEPNITSYNKKPERLIKINKHGTLTIPKSEYREGKTTISGIELDFRTTKSGKVNPKLLKNSSITINTSIKKHVSFAQ